MDRDTRTQLAARIAGQLIANNENLRTRHLYTGGNTQQFEDFFRDSVNAAVILANMIIDRAADDTLV